MEEKGGGGGGGEQNHRGAKHAGEALCWATVPLRGTTVEKLEMRKEEEGRRGERVGGGGRAEVRCKEHQVSAAISFASSAAPTLSESVSRTTADVPR